jgi:hypothetical protein
LRRDFDFDPPARVPAILPEHPILIQPAEPAKGR